MAKLFRAWFMWGFWTSMLQVILIVVFLPLYFLCKNSLSVIEMVSGVL